MSNLQPVDHAPQFSKQPHTPVRRVGVIGGGQLAWMMAEAAQTLGIELIVQTPSPHDPAVAIATQTVLAPVADAHATAQLAKQCDVITFENEFVDLAALAELEQAGVHFYPSLQSLEPLLDKYRQQSFLQANGLANPQFAAVTIEELLNTATTFPLVLKTRRHGYDGQGTFILKNQDSLTDLASRLSGVPLLKEAFIPFERELAVMAARSQTGEIVVYPVVETEQADQVCRRVYAPAAVSEAVTAQVDAIARTILAQLEFVGILGIELFLTKDGTVLVNEIAPRTHNSGHYTLDACATSQFEQQLRAVCGFPLGSPTMKVPGAVMVNLLGYEHAQSDYANKRAQLVQLPNAQVHWYGKAESRPGRKLGHVTVLLHEQPDQTMQQQAIAIAQAIETIWYGSAT